MFDPGYEQCSNEMRESLAFTSQGRTPRSIENQSAMVNNQQKHEKMHDSVSMLINRQKTLKS